jgi:hypothetical protein
VIPLDHEKYEVSEIDTYWLAASYFESNRAAKAALIA